MGLDIYLYKYENYERTKSLKTKYQEQTDPLWESFGDKYESQEAKDAHYKEIEAQCVKIAKKLDLNDDGEDPQKKCINLNSEKHPEHLFKIGYFRSSYNEGGIHHKLLQAGVMSLKEICGYNDKSYEFQPDWEAMKSNCIGTLAQMKEFAEKVGNVSVTCVNHNYFRGISKTVEEDVMRIYQREKAEKTGVRSYRSYSNINGHFYCDPLKVVAAVPGTDALGGPCVFLVFQNDEADKDWYFNALEIMIETCEYVLADEPEKYYLHWSG